MTAANKKKKPKISDQLWEPDELTKTTAKWEQNDEKTIVLKVTSVIWVNREKFISQPSNAQTPGTL